MTIKLARSSDIILALFLVAITAMLLFPLPTVLLDFLLVINISLGVLLLLAGLYMPNTLALLSFPSILLLTTLFRLGLNVASTRLILSQADAGLVINAFGTFLIRGEVVVGIIIFLIITIVNFIVIARGSVRVSEVAARFALDALPGKQLAIDSDLRAGLISAEEAQRRRDDLRKESQLYGSMDGAMKFVQGDAIAGLFIIVTNIVGGIYMGLRANMSLGEAVQTYTVLTVGDGLVNQIPAILISICAGIVVTRVSSGEYSSLGADVQRQIFGRPGTLMFAGALMILVGNLPSLPFVPFVVVGLALFVFGVLKRRAPPDELGIIPRSESEMAPIARRSNLVLGAEDMYERRLAVILLDASVLHRYYRDDVEHYHAWWNNLQVDCFNELGLKLPGVRFLADPMLVAGRFSIVVDGAVVETDSAEPEGMLVEVNPQNAEILGLEILRETTHPLTGSRIFWAVRDGALRRVVEAGQIGVFNPVEYAALRMAAFYSRFPEESLGVTDVLSLEAELEKKYPGLLSQTMKREFLNTPRLTEVLQELLREGVSVRDFRQIVESIATYCSTVGRSLVEEGEFDVHDIVTFVRNNRKRHIISRYLSARRTLKVITISDEIETLLEELPRAAPGNSLALDPETHERLRKGLQEILEPFLNRGLLPISILCRGDVRCKLSNFVASLPTMPGIVTFDELDPAVPVEPAAVWRI